MLRKRLAGVVLALALTAGSPAVAEAAAADGGSAASVLWEAYPESAVHPGNGAGDPRVMDVAVDAPSTGELLTTVRLLLPRGWSRDARRTWPTLWMLHGGGGDHKQYTESSHIAEMAAERDVIVVMPETSPCSSYTDWYNGGRGGTPRWEEYLTRDLPRLLESRYRAGTERAVLGLSMGGGGALSLAARNPGHFRAVAALSPESHTLYKAPGLGFSGPDFVKLGALACSKGGEKTDWRRIWGEPGYPFDTFDPADVRQRAVWAASNPYDIAEGLRGTRLYLTYGNGDGSAGPGWDWNGGNPPPVPASRCSDPTAAGTDDLGVEKAFWAMNNLFRARLAGLGIPAEVCSATGTHSWPYWDREIHYALPMLVGALDQAG
ncbi:alpha/beta hydrolase [Yinghuangia soli]|uniref:Esterase family protein n=1 Tax=Yinghuangia soli TaxID=2908204 RepID=A0AA41PWV1_9ACTN|nr:alpha/beta hydrolase family protein [Yinghuangia soli]MCF2526314.1 esterase family protein [Yinghuangia soli]